MARKKKDQTSHRLRSLGKGVVKHDNTGKYSFAVCLETPWLRFDFCRLSTIRTPYSLAWWLLWICDAWRNRTYHCKQRRFALRSRCVYRRYGLFKYSFEVFLLRHTPGLRLFVSPPNVCLTNAPKSKVPSTTTHPSICLVAQTGSVKLKICHHVRIFSSIPQTTHNFPFTIDIFSRLYTKEIYIFKPSNRRCATARCCHPYRTGRPVWYAFQIEFHRPQIP